VQNIAKPTSPRNPLCRQRHSACHPPQTLSASVVYIISLLAPGARSQHWVDREVARGFLRRLEQPGPLPNPEALRRIIEFIRDKTPGLAPPRSLAQGLAYLEAIVAGGDEDIAIIDTFAGAEAQEWLEASDDVPAIPADGDGDRQRLLFEPQEARGPPRAKRQRPRFQPRALPMRKHDLSEGRPHPRPAISSRQPLAAGGMP
jgi:hypothetical protein